MRKHDAGPQTIPMPLMFSATDLFPKPKSRASQSFLKVFPDIPRSDLPVVTRIAPAVLASFTQIAVAHLDRQTEETHDACNN